MMQNLGAEKCVGENFLPPKLTETEQNKSEKPNLAVPWDQLTMLLGNASLSFDSQCAFWPRSASKISTVSQSAVRTESKEKNEKNSARQLVDILG
jgi:hypothetical protein